MGRVAHTIYYKNSIESKLGYLQSTQTMNNNIKKKHWVITNFAYQYLKVKA